MTVRNEFRGTTPRGVARRERRFAIVARVSTTSSSTADRGALDRPARTGADDDHVESLPLPGAMELPGWRAGSSTWAASTASSAWAR